MKTGKVMLIALLTLAIWTLGIYCSAPASAQLVLSDQKMKIVKVEREFNRLQGRVHEGDNDSVQYIIVDGNTKFSTNNRPVSYDQAWRLFREGMIIRVKGGVTITGKIKAKTILW